ncbi:hypothetical protein H6G41_18160 [Tolypothrix sp. FACHB-123]|uniref:hypothetical protein n=1 Tax=Tolypothrix sp. FACHB-123 TaxID=2692868 RepID=UPI001681F090|nr:hypothetical protein [Tolypothrix sp. FACHB-123]MBD2356526.1 hypothetical protein [Tolypothrix sp. FACHB-123]
MSDRLNFDPERSFFYWSVVSRGGFMGDRYGYLSICEPARTVVIGYLSPSYPSP